jgi:2-keto-4-pentenoate hydratase/2-oxohepta-3-ene-1,7-dioic acid hydratase in catechol pathway
MKLLRYGQKGFEKPAIIDDEGNIRDISSIINDINPRVLATIQQTLSSTSLNTLPLVKKDVRIGACLDVTGKIMCIGYNSRLHTEQMGLKPLEGEIMVFLKANSAVSGPNDPLVYSKIIKKLDWEAELAVVIGKEAKNVDKKDALDYIFGYTCINDISDRYWQFETQDKQYTKGKGLDGFAPIGPYLVTKDEVANPNKLHVILKVNGEMRQDFITSDYINDVETTISYLSQFFTLVPGDIIAMGSAPGNAKFWGEDKFLKPGDKMSLEIVGIGKQEQNII